VYQTGQPHVAVDARVTLVHSQDSREHVLQFVYQPMLDLNGVVSGVIVQGIDMTEQRQAEAGFARVTAEAEWQRRMFETVLSNTADFVYLFDTAGRFTYVNKSLLDLWEKDLSQAVGRNFFDLDYPPDLAARLQRQIAEVVDTGCSVRDETPYTSVGGTAIYEYIFVPVFGPDGAIQAVAGSTRDITERKRSEEALRASERRHRALVTATSDVVYRLTADWTEMQPLDGRDFLLSTSTPIRDWMNQNVPAFEQPRTKAAINKAIEEKSTFELEHQVNRIDGSLGWTFSRAIPIIDEAGNIIEWFGTASDVTRRKQAEEELRDIRSRMEAALDAGAIGTWSWDIQADRFHGDASFARMFTVAPIAVAGESLAGVLDSIHSDDRQVVSDLIAKAIQNGDRYEADYRVAQPGGGWKWVTARGQVERDADGRAVRFPGVVIDISDWKQAERNLALLTEESDRRKRLYETFLSSTPDLAYVFDLDHHFTYANDALLQMWGRTWEEAIGKTCLELGYEPWHAAMHDEEIDRVKATRAPLRGEVPFNGTTGRRIYDYIFVPVFGANGEVEAVAGTTRDVTERKEAEQALRDADRKKDDFLALLAHELRNPLAPIRNGLQVMRLAEGNPTMVATARDMMERQLTHMVRLIDDLLDVSRITRNKMELRLNRVVLADVIGNAVEASSPMIQESGHELTVVLPPEPIVLEADLTRLAQVFSNILSNSAKYTPQGGKIWLSAEPTDQEVIVSVRDTGIGIPEQSLSSIFDMFSQVDRNIERSKGGLGIGLALVKGLVEMHGGTVAADSVEGKGSTFTVRLPISEPIATSGPTANEADVTHGSRRRMLVVDDNRDGADSMAIMLRLLGNEVTTAHDGLEAVAAASAFRPEVILMDIGLPRLNGLDATRQIREQPWGRDIKIIALTGWGQENDREQSRKAGCDGHLVKPVDLADLEKLLENIRQA
jgi:PAS domain S-box-containing protein